MTKMGGDKRTKRSKAPAFWKIPRKRNQFTVTVAPGPHPKQESYPLSVLIRDILGLVRTYREAKTVIYEGKISVDGIARRAPDFPVGLMDVVEIPSIGKTFRLVPVQGNPLHPIVISDSEKSLKLCKVKVKKTVEGGLIQYGFHDGRSILTDNEIKLNVGDVCLLEIPSQKIIKSVKLEKGNLAIITKGKKVGQLGRIEQLKQGSFSRPKMVLLSVEGKLTELPSDIVFVVGEKNPLITISEGVLFLSNSQTTKTAENVMREIKIGKVVLNIGVGKSGDILEKAKKILENLSNQKPCPRKAKKTVRDFGIHKGESIATAVTLRGDNAMGTLKRLLLAKGMRLPISSFDDRGSCSFGIREHIEIPGTKYDPETGIFGLNVSVLLERPGYRVSRRRRARSVIGKNHFVNREEAIKFFKEVLGVEVY